MNRRARLFANYEGRCHICGQRIEGGEFDVDHIIPRDRGGTDDIGNLAPAHVACNRRKQAEVSHTNVGVQFSLFRERHSRHGGKIFRSQIKDYELTCQTWIRTQLLVGKTDSGLPTRFHYWLVDRLQLPLSFAETQRQFLAFCQVMGVSCRIVDDTFIFGQWTEDDETLEDA